MKITDLRWKVGDAPPDDTRLTRVCQAMLTTLRGHPEHDEMFQALILAADVGGDGEAEAVVLSSNVAFELRAMYLLVMLNAELKGTGTTAVIVDDRGQG